MVMINAEINELKKNPSLFSFSFHRKIELQCKKTVGNIWVSHIAYKQVHSA
jgi:hypothetical protein